MDGDACVGALGWLVDDLSVFSCAAAADAAPDVVLDSPTAASTVRGIVPLTTTATDDVGVTQVEFFVDGSSIGLGIPGASDTWTLAWNSADTGDGQAHLITAEATDTISQTTITATSSVTVLSNAASDFDGDGDGDVAVFRPPTGTGTSSATPPPPPGASPPTSPSCDRQGTAKRRVRHHRSRLSKVEPAR